MFLAGADDDILFAFVHGSGFLRSVDAGSTWTPVRRPPVQPLIRALNPRGRVVPMALDRAEDGTLWLAGIGGIFRSEDAGTWVLVDLMTSSEHLNVLFRIPSGSRDRRGQPADSIRLDGKAGAVLRDCLPLHGRGQTREIIGTGSVRMHRWRAARAAGDGVATMDRA